jgi:hypothetical protein
LDSCREAAIQLFEGFSEMGLCGSGAQAERRRPQVLVYRLLEDLAGRVGGCGDRLRGAGAEHGRDPGGPEVEGLSTIYIKKNL